MEIIFLVIVGAIILWNLTAHAPVVKHELQREPIPEDENRNSAHAYGALVLLVLAMLFIVAVTGNLGVLVEQTQANWNQTMGQWWEDRPASIR